ncbi:MAG: 50S ribosomal protein L4, partial [Bacteroidota bacterium]
MKLEVFNASGAGTGREVELPENIFGIEPNEHAVYLAVKAYLANQRQGTHKAKERGEVAGSTKKLHRQKGTGGSRKGDIKNPVFRGGGRIFGPRPRNYRQRLNKKVSRLARASVFSARASEGALKVVENISFDAPRTKEYINLLNSFELQNQKVLLITGDYDQNVYLSSRNLPKAQVTAAGELSTYDLMNATTILIAEGAIDK